MDLLRGRIALVPRGDCLFVEKASLQAFVIPCMAARGGPCSYEHPWLHLKRKFEWKQDYTDYGCLSRLDQRLNPL